MSNLYYCNECRVSFVRKGEYQSHLKIHIKGDFKCQDCGREFETENKLHGHLGKCKVHSDNRSNKLNTILTEEFLNNMFVINKNYSVLYVANVILKDKNISNGDIIYQAKRFNIKLPTVKDSSNMESVRNKYISTCNDKYGADNCLSYGTSLFYKRNNTIKEKYGVENVYQLESVKETIKKTLFDRYGVDNPNYIPGRVKNVGLKSYPHKMVENWLQEMNIDFISENITDETKAFNTDLNKVYKPRPDIMIKNYKIIIEIYGDMWHANPEKYEDSDIIITWMGERSAKDIRKYNQIREIHLNNCNFVVIVLWTSKIKRYKQNNLKELLKKEIETWKMKLEYQKLNEFQMRCDTIYL